ncbi:CH-like domain in sperm protein [Phytophthora infestans]|uniref:Spermatogenesis-associated protein 4 n=1 Tax=Phytophthora infestans TaxID=4787 RepID=A0A8S9TLI1_PHYIN|nr:CH-like domain in sperm protein [Phytophthora infestans]
MADEAKSNKLNRELLRWIQSLDLAYSIKNVKRDFANGFLVAEILSRYYDKDISMHSYDNGIGMKVRKDNWDQLVKIFGRFVDLEPLTNKSDIDAIVHCQNGAAVVFLTKLYQCLTKRTIQPTAVANLPSSGHIAAPMSIAKSLNTVDEIPPYAKPTNSAFIRDKMREPEIAEMRDQTQLNRRVRDIHSQLEETQHLERLMTDTPDRYPAIRSASKATVLRGATKPVRNDDSNPVLMTQQIVREVQIKTINQKGLEKLRATREAKENESLGYSGSSCLLGEARGVASFDTRGMNGSMPELIQKRRPLDLLNEIVARKLSSMELTLKPRGGKEKFENFLDNVSEGNVFGESECAKVLGSIEEEVELLAGAFLDFPRDFWKFVGLMYPMLAEHDESHILFHTTVHLFIVLGQHCVRRDSSAASLFMPEFLLPKLTVILYQYSNKRAPLLRILYAFLPNTVLAHIQAIKQLREALNDDIPLFIHLLAVLIVMESELDETLVDLYHYYCCIGLETTCEKLRAACLSMLIPFLNYDVNLVVDLLPRLTQLSSRHAWWEVKAQLVIVASAVLRIVPTQRNEDESNGVTEEPPRDFTEQIELCLTIIEREFHPEASLNLRRVGLSYLSRNLEHYQELVPLYIDVLLSLPTAVRHVMLFTKDTGTGREAASEDEENPKPSTGIENQLPILGASGAVYQLLPLVTNWDSMAIAKQVFYEHKNNNSADPDVLLVILKCFEQLLHTNQQLNVRMLYDQMKNYVVLGFASANTCKLSASIFRIAVAALDGSDTDVFQYAALVDALQQLITRDVEDVRQQTVVKMLHDAHVLSSVWAERVLRCVSNLRSTCDADTFKASLFSITFEL